MSAAGDVQLHVNVQGGDRTPPPPPPLLRITSSKLRQIRWWLLVALNVLVVLAGQTVSILLGRFYFNEGGGSMWMATFVQTAGFPVLLVPLFLFASPTSALPADEPSVFKKVTLVYIFLGLIATGDNLMYSYGLLYLPVSTYSLICATQVAFNAVFAFFLNDQKFSAHILNSIVLLTFSAALLGFESDDSHGGPKGKYVLGFVLTLAASATFSLILSLVQLTFQRVLRRENFAVVLQLQVGISAVATAASVVGLFASGEYSILRGEMEGFRRGRVSYVMTLAWTAVGWQVTAVGLLGLVFVVSSLFANVVSSLGLTVVPVFAVAFFHEKIQGLKVIAMLTAIWGFASYVYHHYLDDKKTASSSDD